VIASHFVRWRPPAVPLVRRVSACCCIGLVVQLAASIKARTRLITTTLAAPICPTSLRLASRNLRRHYPSLCDRSRSKAEELVPHRIATVEKRLLRPSFSKV
jgi:hypothetical protein